MSKPSQPTVFDIKLTGSNPRSSPSSSLFFLTFSLTLPPHTVSVVTYSIIVSRILYALPARGGFLSGELINRINAFFRHVKRFGYIDTVLTVDLLSQSEYDLFVKTRVSQATLHIICFPV